MFTIALEKNLLLTGSCFWFVPLRLWKHLDRKLITGLETVEHYLVLEWNIVIQIFMTEIETKREKESTRSYLQGSVSKYTFKNTWIS